MGAGNGSREREQGTGTGNGDSSNPVPKSPFPNPRSPIPAPKSPLPSPKKIPSDIIIFLTFAKLYIVNRLCSSMDRIKDSGSFDLGSNPSRVTDLF